MNIVANGHRHQKTLISLDVNNKCADQPAHMRSLINAFVSALLSSTSNFATYTFSILYI